LRASPPGSPRRVELARAQLPGELVQHRIDHAGLVGLDEGHGFAKKKNQDYQQYATVAFVQQYLLGGIQ